eukprot:351781-Chlamydomonas_euryale.AAC.1
MTHGMRQGIDEGGNEVMIGHRGAALRRSGNKLPHNRLHAIVFAWPQPHELKACREPYHWFGVLGASWAVNHSHGGCEPMVSM